MRFPPPFALARLGEAFADQRNAETIAQWQEYARNLEYHLERYRQEYDYLMEYTDQVKKQYTRVTDEISEEYLVDYPTLPPGIIASLKARVAEINFFESDGDPPAKDQRIYSTTFRKSSARYIWCEFNLHHFPPAQRLDYQVYFSWHATANPKVPFNTFQSSFYILPEWGETSHFASGYGANQAGSWQEGNYFVIIFIAGERAGHGVFDVV